MYVNFDILKCTLRLRSNVPNADVDDSDSEDVTVEEEEEEEELMLFDRNESLILFVCLFVCL
jgi:hypothetical protein